MCFIKMVQSFDQLLKILVELPLSVTCSDHHYFCCDLHHLVNVKYQARVVQLGACQLAIPEIQVQTSPGANQYEQIFLSVSHKQEKAIANKDRAMPCLVLQLQDKQMQMKIGPALLECAEDLLDEAPTFGRLQLISQCTTVQK